MTLERMRRRPRQPRWTLSLSLFAAAALAQGNLAVGQYAGDGAVTRSITGLGFAPSFVIVKAATAVDGMGRTDTMPAGMSKILHAGNPVVPGCITSLDVDGFSVGGDARTNGAGVTYYWEAWPSLSGVLRTGTYQGDGQTNREVTGLGFQPDFALILPRGGESPNWRTSAMPDGSGAYLNSQGLVPQRVLRFTPDGFVMGNNSDVNFAGVVYDYFAAACTGHVCAVGSFVGSGVGFTVSGLGLVPAFVLVKADGAVAVQRSSAIPSSTDLTLSFGDDGAGPNLIQRLTPDGFQLGAGPSVNTPGAQSWWLAFASQATAPADGGRGPLRLNVGCACSASRSDGGLGALLVMALVVFARGRGRR